MNRYEKIIKLYAERRNFNSVGDYYIYLRELPKEELELEITDLGKFDFDIRMDEGIDSTNPEEVEQSVNIERTFRRHLKNIRKKDDIPMENKEPEIVEREIEDNEPEKVGSRKYKDEEIELLKKRKERTMEFNVESDKITRLYDDKPEVDLNEELEKLSKESENIECTHNWMFIKEDFQFKYVVCRNCLKVEANKKVKENGI